jgi:hypothetical protein
MFTSSVTKGQGGKLPARENLLGPSGSPQRSQRTQSVLWSYQQQAPATTPETLPVRTPGQNSALVHN